jgi:hypothetical protein
VLLTSAIRNVPVNWWISPRAMLGLLVVCAAVAWTMVLLI